MRLLTIIAAAALALAGCSDAIEKSVGEHAAPPGQSWTMQVLGDEKDQVYLVTGPDGRSAAARVKDGVSSLVPDAEAKGLLSEAQTALAADQPPERVSISAPGVSIKVAADSDESAAGGRGRVAIDVGGVSIHVDGDEAGGHDRGTVRIAGVNADAARKFIDDADDLSAETKAQMRAKLGL